MRRGEIRWYTFALPDKRRPVLLLSRDSVLPSLNEVIVVPATRTIRGIETEVVLTEDDGMPTACALNFDHVSWLGRSALVQPLRVSRRVAGPRSSARSSLLAASRPTHRLQNGCETMGDLHDAAERGDIDEVCRLLDGGVPVDELDDGDETALHGAAAFGHTEVVRLLLERGAAVDQTDGSQFRTALMAAAGNGHLGAVQALLERGADCNAADDYDETVLVRAAGSGNVPVVQALLARAPIPRGLASCRAYRTKRRSTAVTPTSLSCCVPPST